MCVMKKLIAVIDDEEDILNLVSLHLKKNNYDIITFKDGISFIEALKKKLPDLIILDLMLPDKDGIEICKYLKSNDSYKKIPIIMLTAKHEEVDKLVGLEVGADDYITKPFSLRELSARVKAVLRRWEIEPETSNNNVLNIDNKLFVDLNKHEVCDINDNIINLTQTEFKLLHILLDKRGWVFSREKLLDKIWGNEKYVIDRTIDVHIKYLREKLKESGKLIKNIRGVGYKFDFKE